MRKYFIILALFTAIIIDAVTALAFDDGVAAAKKAEGRYIAVYVAPAIDTASLLQKLNMRPSDTLLTGETLSSKATYEDEMTNMLDVLFLQVSDILDMHLYSLKVNIKVCQTQTQLKNIYNDLFHSDLKDKQSFYVYGLNTIYVCEESFRREIIGHEMAHAIICHYFAISPPIKIQEILAMYTEYNLRKTEKSEQSE
jgi:hypothetical protein